MLVKVHLLRQAGERLPAGQMRSQPAHVGWIRLFDDPGSQVGHAVRVAVLQLPEGRQLELYDAQLIRWDGRGMILAGEERSTGIGRRRVECHRQAWWCKPIDVRDVAPPPMTRDPLALEGPVESDWIDNLA